MNEERFNKKLSKIFRFNKESRETFKNHYKLMEEIKSNYKALPHNYKLGDDVKLKKHNLMRGEGGTTPLSEDKIKFISEQGFISPDFINKHNKNQKTPLTIPVWNIQKDMLLKDYILSYSGATIRYHLNEGQKYKKFTTKLIPYNKIEEELSNNDDIPYFKWEMEETKEIRFMPNLSSNRVNIAFILDLNNEYGNKLIQDDIYNLNFNEKVVKSFIPKFMYKYIYGDRDDFTTNRESAIIYGIPKEFITGILVSKKFEKDEEIINKLKKYFPQCYICNIDGKVIRI